MAEMVSKVSEKIKSAAEYTVQKTRSCAAIAKYTVQMKVLKADLNKCFSKLGEALYRQVKLDEDKDELIASRIVEAQELMSEIDALKELIERTKAENSVKDVVTVAADNDAMPPEEQANEEK